MLSQNPFADFGGIVSGPRFIGRRLAASQIRTRVVEARSGGNVAIVGQRRIGKSSLAHQVLMSDQGRLRDHGRFTVWIDVATTGNIHGFLDTLVRKTLNTLRRSRRTSVEIEALAASAMVRDIPREERHYRLEQFMIAVCQSGMQPIIVLDEFDAAERLFKSDRVIFEVLRDLSYTEGRKILFVTTSIKAIKNIEIESVGSSTFEGTFLQIPLGLFEPIEMNEFWAMFDGIGLSSDDLREEFDEYCGRHPFLLAIFGFYTVEAFRDGGSNPMRVTASRSVDAICDHYDRIIRTAPIAGLREKLLAVALNGSETVAGEDLNYLEKYGYIERYREGFRLFCTRFETHLKNGSALTRWTDGDAINAQSGT